MSRFSEQRRFVSNAWYKTLIKCPYDDLVDVAARREIETPLFAMQIIEIKHAGKPA